MNQDRKFAVWKMGLLLSEAFLSQASKQDVVRRKRLMLAMSPDAMMRRVAENIENQTSLLRRSNDTARWANELSDIDNRLQKKLLFRLRDGTFAGFGFTSPRTAECVPARVPIDLWDGTIIWEKSRVSSISLTMEEVRIVSVRNPASYDYKTKRLRGRPGIKDVIQSAIANLSADGLINPDNSYTSHYALIIERAIAMYPDQFSKKKTLSIQTLKKHANPALNAEYALLREAIK